MAAPVSTVMSSVFEAGPSPSVTGTENTFGPVNLSGTTFCESVAGDGEQVAACPSTGRTVLGMEYVAAQARPQVKVTTLVMRKSRDITVILSSFISTRLLSRNPSVAL